MDRVSERYVTLIKMLGASMGHRHGWRAEVARQLGIHGSYITRLLNGERVTVGREYVDRAIGKGLASPDFFYGDKAPTVLAQAAAIENVKAGLMPPWPTFGVSTGSTDWAARTTPAFDADLFNRLRSAPGYTWTDIVSELANLAHQAAKLAPEDHELAERFAELLRQVQEHAKHADTKEKK